MTCLTEALTTSKLYTRRVLCATLFLGGAFSMIGQFKCRGTTYRRTRFASTALYLGKFHTPGGLFCKIPIFFGGGGGWGAGSGCHFDASNDSPCVRIIEFSCRIGERNPPRPECSFAYWKIYMSYFWSDDSMQRFCSH